MRPIHKFASLVRFAIQILLASVATQASAQMDALQDGLALSKDAILLMPAEQASGNFVESWKWSSDGKYLMMKRRVFDYSIHELERVLGGLTDDSAAEKHQILSYSVVSGKTRVLLEDAGPHSELAFEWIPQTSSALVTSKSIDNTGTHTFLTLVSASGGLSGTVGRDDSFDYRYTGFDPAFPYLWFVQNPEKAVDSTVVRFVGEKGLVPREAVVPAVSGMLTYPGKGSKLYFVQIVHGKQQPGGWSIEPATSEVARVDSIPPSENPPATTSLDTLEARQKVGTVKPATYATSVCLYTGDPERTVLVSADAEGPDLAPGGTAVSYRSRGSLMVRRIVHVPLEYYRNQLLISLRRKALNAAKQIGLAMLMYANDNDDNYVANASGWQDKLREYLKTDEFSGMFNYTFAGGNASKVESPATTELGYVNGPDGRAVVYTDGHAKYLPKT